MSTVQEAKGPSIAELQRFVREKTPLEFLLATGKKEHGTLKWFDETSFCLQQDAGTLTLLRSGVIGYRPKH